MWCDACFIPQWESGTLFLLCHQNGDDKHSQVYCSWSPISHLFPCDYNNTYFLSPKCPTWDDKWSVLSVWGMEGRPLSGSIPSSPHTSFNLTGIIHYHSKSHHKGHLPQLHS